MPGESFVELVELMRRLRAPDGCPWDRQQTYETIKPYLLEETYEVVDAIGKRDFAELKSELGDLLLQVVFFSQMAAEDGHFTIDGVVESIHSKMVRRHPHVFGDARADTAEDVLRRWHDLKTEEERQAAEAQGREYRPRQSVLDGVSRAVPALLEAYQLTSRAAFVGFDWPDVHGVIEKAEEEVRELRQALAEPDEARRRQQVEDEVGDLLFVMVNLARALDLEPESALRKANQKFRTRFQWMEARLAERNQKPGDVPLEQMEELWQQSKREISA